MTATQHARRLRRDATDAEKAMWRLLRGRRFAGYKFRRQVAIGPFVVDLACHAAKLVIEIDGGQHAERTEEDARRTRIIAAHGYRVIRFWNDDVLINQESVADAIAFALEGQLP